MLKKEELSRNLCIFARERRGERLRVGDQRSGMAAHARLSCLASDQRSSGRLASPRTAALSAGNN